MNNPIPNVDKTRSQVKNLETLKGQSDSQTEKFSA